MLKENFKRKMAKLTDLPESSFGECPYIEIEGRESVKIDRCLEILSYNEDEAVFRLVGMDAAVIGSGLTLCSYGTKSVRLCGRIKSVVLDWDDDGSREDGEKC